MSRTAVLRVSAAGGRRQGNQEERLISETIAQLRSVVRDLNRITHRMDRKLASRLRQLETLRQ